MPAVYHIRSADFRGTTLYPLNQLRARYPDVYEAQRAKYRGREWLLEERIPLLDVLWNDVIHCAPVHPHHLFLALQAAGAAPNPELTWFQIPVDRLAGRRVVYFRHTTAGRDSPADEFEPFDPGAYRELPGLPAENIAYLRAAVGAGRRPLLFNRVPHVLVEGPLEVADVPLLTWATPP